MFYVSWRLREAHFYVFYEFGRAPGGPASNGPKPPGVSAREDLTRAGGGGVGGERSGSVARVLRVLEALGGSFVRVLRVREVPARSRI